MKEKEHFTLYMFVDCVRLNYSYLCILAGAFGEISGRYKKKPNINNVSGSKSGQIRPHIPSEIL